MRMGHGFRSLLRLAAADAAADTVARAAESARRLLDELAPEPARHRQPPVPAVWPLSPIGEPVAVPPQSAVPPRLSVPGGEVAAMQGHVVQASTHHAFGPAPSVVPSRGIGFRPPPTTDAMVDELEASGELDDEDHRPTKREAPPDEPAVSPIDRLLARRHAQDKVSEPEPEPKPKPAKKKPPKPRPDRVSARDEPAPAPPRPKGKHRRTAGAVSGTVSNVYEHGLRGLRVEIVDDAKKVVASAVTGSKGTFVVDDVPAGTYRLRAHDDVDDDFEKSWHGGAKFGKAETFKVKSAKTRRGIDVVLRSNAQIGVEVTVTQRSAAIAVGVTHQATGAPATGEVELHTKAVDITLPLTHGTTSLALGTAGKKLRVDYLGDHQTRSASVKVRLR
ncbi:MAG: hypothetical protein ACR2FE_05025 [Aeromicrobium sp.]